MKVSVSFRQRRKRSGAGGSKFLWVAGFLLIGFCAAAGRSRGELASSFAIDLDQPYQTVVDAVRFVASNGVIAGTFEYRGDQSLPGAEIEESCKLFAPWKGGGQVFYKVRKKVLSPVHFLNSNDVGTVAVRYVVQPVGGNATRLFIDAAFVENSHHGNHPSDGYVETSEFGVIGKSLRELNEPPVLAGESSSRQVPNVNKASPPPPAAAVVLDKSKTQDIEQSLADEKEKLEADRQALEKAQSRLTRLQGPARGRVRAPLAELKIAPYSHSRAVTTVKQDQQVTILASSPYWYRVRSEDGQVGWIHRDQLEFQP
jgi:hypothetical protein